MQLSLKARVPVCAWALPDTIAADVAPSALRVALQASPENRWGFLKYWAVVLQIPEAASGFPEAAPSLT